VEPFQVEVEPFQVEVEPFQVEVEPFQVELEPFQVELEPFQVELEPFQVELGAGGTITDGGAPITPCFAWSLIPNHFFTFCSKLERLPLLPLWKGF
jgi:hypothetical protein